MLKEGKKRGPGMPGTRTILLVGATAALFSYGWICAGVYRSTVAPETSTLLPPGDRLEAAAAEHLEEGLRRLHEPSDDPAASFRAFREELATAEGLLERSLRADPTRARALARLASVRWELDPPGTDAERQHYLETIRLASAMAPSAASIQFRLGELLLRMGQREDARTFFDRAVVLDPALGHKIVATLEQRFLNAPDIFEASPRQPSVLAALEPIFSREGRHGPYLSLLDQVLENSPAASAPLLASYGKACERIGQPGRLLERMDDLGPLTDPVVESERLKQTARAHMALGNAPMAITTARRARLQIPDSPYLAENEGDLLLAANRGAAAIDVFREALELVVRRHEAPGWRARLYRKIGQAEESRGNTDRALLPYRLALRLNPDEPHARMRVTQLERAAGLRR